MRNSNQLHVPSPRDYVTLKASRKRKETEGGFDAPVKKFEPLNTTTKTTKQVNNVETDAQDNNLLAGYLAHEFLTHGTLFGKKWDPARRAEAGPLSPFKSRKEPAVADKKPPVSDQMYADVASLLKSGGVHIPGIVNPTQLVEWLQQQ